MLVSGMPAHLSVMCVTQARADTSSKAIDATELAPVACTLDLGLAKMKSEAVDGTQTNVAGQDGGVHVD